jgi:prefoldin subunit 5
MFKDLVNWAMGLERPIIPWITDAREEEALALKQEAQELTARAERIESYAEALTEKNNAVVRIVEANASIEKSTIELAVNLEKANDDLIPLRRKFRKVKRDFQAAALRVRQQSSIYEIFKP